VDVVLAQPRGFCAGVVRAIEIVERALALHGRPVYVYHEIVHNPHVVEDLRARGAVFVDDVEAIPPGAVTVFSAHGVANDIVSRARRQGLRVIDATCPLVAKVHLQLQRYAKLGYELVVIGHHGHEEVTGTVGSVDSPVHVVATVAQVDELPIAATARVAYVTQTTLSVDDTKELIEALRRRWPTIEGPEFDDICYATQNRQNAVRRMAAEVDVVLVVGARNSSNSNRLRELAAQLGVPAHLIEDADDLDPTWLAGRQRVGITAGASAPEYLVDGVRARLATLGARSTRQLPGTSETVMFRLPSTLLLRSAS
jgi:4-hydroxy-3-methylbut-2-enyl diphosphate reductase